MDALLIFIFLCSGIGLLFFGAHILIQGAASFGLRVGLPTLVIGLTILGYGTGLPELIVSAQASVSGNGDIAIGNVVGSNIANVGLILGLTALYRPIPIARRLIGYDGVIMVSVTLLFFFLSLIVQKLSREIGFLFIGGFITYTLFTLYYGKQRLEEADEDKPTLMASVLREWIFIVSGLLFLFIGGKLFLQGAITLAKVFMINEAVVGLTIVALGTSLPELATSLVSVMKRHGSAAIGNIVGSNIFNILAVAGIAGSICPIDTTGIHWLDYGFMLCFSLALWWVIHSGSTVTRWEGCFLLLCYALYIAYLILTRV